MIISQFYPLKGGAEVQAQRLSAHLIRNGYKVYVLTRHVSGLPVHEVIDGVPIYRAIKVINCSVLWGLSYCFKVGVFLYRKRNDYDIIHCHILHGFHTLVAVLFKYLYRKKVVVKMSSSGETSDVKLLKKMPLGRLMLWWCKKVDAVVSVCQCAHEELLDSGFRKEVIYEIPNGVEVEKYMPVSKGEEREEQRITFVGRMDEFKGGEVLIQAFKQVLLKHNKVLLVMVGAGLEEWRLKKLAQDIGCGDRVIFRGMRENVLPEYQATDIFVLPSFSEGMSNVVLEAMACGLPVVVTSVGGNCDMVRNNRNGLVVPPGDVGKLAEALLELLENNRLAKQLGKEARRTVERSYTMNRVVDEYIELYAKLTG